MAAVGRTRPTIAIVGGGASGTLTAIHLLSRSERQPFRLVMFDSGGSVGRGVAFSTLDSSHLLNVCAGQMSAFSDDPNDFARWLLTQGLPDAHHAFVARGSFGSYLEDRLRALIEERRHGVAVEVVHDTVEDIDHAGPGPLLRLKSGQKIAADAVVLATGLAPPKVPTALRSVVHSDRFIEDPWRASGTWPIQPSDDVTLIGTGLTAVDVVLTLTNRGHRGPIRAISRHGLLPTTHRLDLDVIPELREATGALQGTTILELFRGVRRLTDVAAQTGSDWRIVIDALRPRLSTLWGDLSLAERDRFMRLLVRYWDVHRHRMPLETASRLDALRQDGALVVHAGRVQSAEEIDDRLLLMARLKNSNGYAGVNLSTRWVVNCTGPQDSLCFGGDELATRLTGGGLIRPGPLGMGIDTDETSRAHNSEGVSVPWLWSVGALMRGRLFETTAVPEIRKQAEQLSLQIHDYLTAGKLQRHGNGEPVSDPITRSTPAQPRVPTSFQVVTCESVDLGDRSYLVHDGSVAIVIDPQCDITRPLAEAARCGVAISHVLETHIHNDYVSGGLALARSSQATYVLSADEPVAFGAERTGVRDGDVLRAGSLEIEVMHTPGHTPHHLSYVVRKGADDAALFSGGSMLHGASGRTDLFDPAATEILAHAQWRSMHRMADALDPLTSLYPTHGFGSFCSSSPTQSTSDQTLREQWMSNPALLHDEQRFVSELLKYQRPHPRYFNHMASLNRQGKCRVFPAKLTRISTDLVGSSYHEAVVVDLRPRLAFAAAHVPGSINIEWGDSFAAYLGWTLPWGAPITLISAEWSQIESAARSLARIGVSDVSGAIYEPVGPVATYRAAGFSEFRDAVSGGQIAKLLDARDRVEWDAGHLIGAELMPFYCIEAGVSLLPADTPIWVHCARGYRAAIAASLLERFHRVPVLIDDHFEHAVELGLMGHEGQLVGVAQ
jgi:hydroxyacylglutathione hydrolase